MKLPQFSNDRVVSITLNMKNRPVCFFASYLPTRSGGTDDFKAAMEFLDAGLEINSHYSDVLTLGADPGTVGGPLSSIPHNEQGNRWNFISCHLNPPSRLMTPRPSHTYSSEAHHSVSTINHILCPSQLQPALSHCVVLDDNPINLSDHLPVICKLSCTLGGPTGALLSIPSVQIPQLNWKKVSKETLLISYTKAVEHALISSLSLPDTSALVAYPPLIDSHIEHIIDTLIEAGINNVPTKNFVHYRRPDWNCSLSGAHKLSRNGYTKPGLGQRDLDNRITL